MAVGLGANLPSGTVINHLETSLDFRPQRFIGACGLAALAVSADWFAMDTHALDVGGVGNCRFEQLRVGGTQVVHEPSMQPFMAINH